MAVLPGLLVAMLLGNDPGSPPPVVGMPFPTQPQVLFVDRFENIVETVSDVLVQCELIETNGAPLADQTLLLGSRSATTVGGVAQFTSLRIDRPGRFLIRFFFSDYQTVADGEAGEGFQVNSGTLAQIQFVSQPQSGAANFALDPAVSLQFLDSLGNAITTDYSFVLQFKPTTILYEGVPKDDISQFACGDCGKLSGRALFNPGGAKLFTFSDLVPVLDGRIQVKAAAVLQVYAVNMSRCVQQGTFLDCDAFPGDPAKSPRYLDGQRFEAFSSPFDVYLVSQLAVVVEPGDTSAAT
jgi:hypothetical protein